MKEFFIEKESKQLDNCPVYAQLQSTDKKRQVIRPHIHSAIELLIVKKGGYTVYVGDRRFDAQPGDIVLLRSNTIHHTYSVCDGSSYYVIKVRPSLLTELSDGADDGKYLMFFALDRESAPCFWTKADIKNTPLGCAADRFVTEFEQHGFALGIAVTLAVSGILLEIMRRDTQQFKNADATVAENVTRRIYDTLLYINKNYNQPITAESCAKLSGMSYSYFSRMFSKTVGKSFKEYLNFTRINHAQKALMSTDMTVTETAAHCGFDNVSYFISVYKRIKGKTPHRDKNR